MKIDDSYDPTPASGTNANSLNARNGTNTQIRRSYRILAGLCAILMLLPFLATNIWAIGWDGISVYAAKKSLVDWLVIPTSLYAVFVMYCIAIKGKVPGQRTDND